MTQPNSVPALARTDVRPAEPAVPDFRRRTAARAIAIGVAVLATIALLIFGLVFALRHDLVDPALLNAGFFGAWR
jgi:hypothetical protein